MMQHRVIVRHQSRHAYHSSIRHSLLFTHSRTSLNRKGREGWEGPPLTLSLCQTSYNSLYTCRNSIMLLQCMLDVSLHVSLKQGAPQWQMSCTLYCVMSAYFYPFSLHVYVSCNVLRTCGLHAMSHCTTVINYMQNNSLQASRPYPLVKCRGATKILLWLWAAKTDKRSDLY